MHPDASPPGVVNDPILFGQKCAWGVQMMPRIKALSNDVNKRFHELDSQMRKNNFDAASVFVRLDSVEQAPQLPLGNVRCPLCRQGTTGLTPLLRKFNANSEGLVESLP